VPNDTADFTVFFAHSGPMCVKAERRMLMKLNPGRDPSVEKRCSSSRFHQHFCLIFPASKMRSYLWQIAFGNRCTDFSSQIHHEDVANLVKVDCEIERQFFLQKVVCQ